MVTEALTKSYRVSLLGTLDAPFLGYIIREFIAQGISIDSVILDSKAMSAKDWAIHEERTQGRFPLIPLDQFEEHNIPFYFVNNHVSGVTVNLLRKRGIDILVNSGTPRVLNSHILNAPKRGVINCHPGLLPKYRGCTCVEWAIYFNEQVGNTVHFMTPKIDEGPIILKEALVFSKQDYYVDIRTKVYRHGIELLANAVNKIIAEDITCESLEPQPEGQYFKPIEPEKMREVIGKLQRGEYAYQCK